MRKPPQVPLGDPVALAAWIVETRAAVEDLYAMTLDATARKRERRHARVFLRDQARRRHQALGALLGALAPSAQVPAGAVSEARPAGQNGAAAAATAS
jgi:hypothetical protein